MFTHVYYLKQKFQINKLKLISLYTIMGLLIIPLSSTNAQDAKQDLAQQAANPIANLMSFPFQNNIDFGYGEFDRARNVLYIQPVIPLMGGKLSFVGKLPLNIQAHAYFNIVKPDIGPSGNYDCRYRYFYQQVL